MRYALGFDGGGTKTDCVLMDERAQFLPARDPDRQMQSTLVQRLQPPRLPKRDCRRFVQYRKRQRTSDSFWLGISGAAEPELRFEIQSCLQPTFSKATISVTSDLVLSLGATGESRVL